MWRFVDLHYQREARTLERLDPAGFPGRNWPGFAGNLNDAAVKAICR